MMYVFHGVEDYEEELEDSESSVQHELMTLQSKLAKLEKGF